MTIPDHIMLALSRRWAGETLAQEQHHALEQWLALPAHAQQAQYLQRTWEAAGAYPSHYTPDSQAAWQKLKPQLHSPDATATADETSTRIRTLPRRRRLWWMAAAASLMLMLSALYNWWLNDDEPEQIRTVAAASGTSLEVALPDGSLIVLQNGSELSYPEPFDKSKVRWTELRGEAYFKVAHHPRKPFRVLAAHTYIEVLGTSFNVRAPESSGSVEVTVESGKVNLVAQDNPDEAMVLQPGQRGICTASGDMTLVNDTALNALSWMTSKLSFRNTPLPQVIEAVNRHYGVSISLNSEVLAKCTYSGVFQKATLDEVLQTLQITYGLKVAKTPKAPDKMVLKGGSCNK